MKHQIGRYIKVNSHLASASTFKSNLTVLVLHVFDRDNVKHDATLALNQTPDVMSGRTFTLDSVLNAIVVLRVEGNVLKRNSSSMILSRCRTSDKMAPNIVHCVIRTGHLVLIVGFRTHLVRLLVSSVNGVTGAPCEGAFILERKLKRHRFQPVALFPICVFILQ